MTSGWKGFLKLQEMQTIEEKKWINQSILNFKEFSSKDYKKEKESMLNNGRFLQHI